MAFFRFNAVGKRGKKHHPLPLRMRNPFIPRELGGGKGYRGPGWRQIRAKIIKRDKERSTVSGFDLAQGNGLQVDHIHPFRLGGRNIPLNLRVTDFFSNPAIDHMRGFGERPPDRSEKW